MAADRFPVFIERVLSHEGGFTTNPKDPGNWTGGKVGVGVNKGTKFGIAAASYPTLDIRNLTREQAIAIYRRDFWERVGAHRVSPAFAFQLLDAAVNHGIGNATRMLQTAAGVAPDGKAGPVTWKAVDATPAEDLVLQFIAARLDFYAGLAKFDTFGRGWIKRMAGNARYAALDN